MMLERTRALRQVRARDPIPTADDLLRQVFRTVLPPAATVDARFFDSQRQTVFGAAGMTHYVPITASLLANPTIHAYLAPHLGPGCSILLQRTEKHLVTWISSQGGMPGTLTLPDEVAAAAGEIFNASDTWAGTLDESGRHIFDPRSPAPGPHFFTNLLLGRRIGFPHPLQTTPKSVVDQLGRGSFRSHAATQVLATRWDMLAEENGFPANRQFYLVERGRQIFYSANLRDENLAGAETVHGQNYTKITCHTRCGLEIARTIFLLPSQEGLPLATEVHSIVVANHSAQERRIRLIVTGMFGPVAPNALWEDVVYTNVSVEARVVADDRGEIVAVSPHYHPTWTKGDERFHTTIFRDSEHVGFATEYATSYQDFIGQGTLERPEGLLAMSNRLARKGPAFFALGRELRIPVSGSARADNFTCLVSDKAQPDNSGKGVEDMMVEQITTVIDRFTMEDAVAGALADNLDFLHHYRAHLQIHSGDSAFDATVNYNLPFQILYQTFVSRSFDQTQKGYREIGFREVQDLFASLPFLVSTGEARLARQLIGDWAGQVYEFGYANHNFYWTGKEPGDFSDDPLWLIQAVQSYVNLTGDIAFLEEPYPVAGTSGRRRTLYDTIRAILHYCGEISVGKHGLPLLDRADWNDTLRLDPDYLNGPQKEAAYRRQLANGGQQGEPLESDNCESVMNGFLLKIALDATRRFAEARGERDYARHLVQVADEVAARLQRDAWKGDFFARVLINRPGQYRYLGANGDGLSADPDLDGSYFLNSFSWSVLAGVAREDQIGKMLGVIKHALLTPFGLKLCSPVQFSSITSRGGTAEYFYGDRENGGVFKHANMMAAMAMLSAAKTVARRDLAAELADLAYTVFDAVMPHHTMQDPYRLAGNPRFCTQYNNSQTGENVGPTLSGTAPWLWLALRSAWGIEMGVGGLQIDPILRDGQTRIALELKTASATYDITIAKPKGFHRLRDSKPQLAVDGHEVGNGRVPPFADGKRHQVTLVLVGSA